MSSRNISPEVMGFLGLLNVLYGALLSVAFAFMAYVDTSKSPNIEVELILGANNIEVALMAVYFVLDWWGINAAFRYGVYDFKLTPIIELAYIGWAILLVFTVLSMSSGGISPFVWLSVSAVVAGAFDIRFVFGDLKTMSVVECLKGVVFISRFCFGIGMFSFTILIYFFPEQSLSWLGALVATFLLLKIFKIYLLINTNNYGGSLA